MLAKILARLRGAASPARLLVSLTIAAKAPKPCRPLSQADSWAAEPQWTGDPDHPDEEKLA